MSNSTVPNRQVGDIYYTRAIQVGIPEIDAQQFAGLVRACKRPLYESFRRRPSLTGVRELELNLTTDAHQKGKALLEQILAALIKDPSAVAQYQRSESQSGGSIVTIGHVEESGGFAGTEYVGITAGTGARWNGQKYITDWRKYT